MAKRLVKNGNEVTFVTTSAYLSGSYEFQKGWNVIEIEGFKLHVLRLNYSNKDGFFQRIVKFILFSLRSTFKTLSIKSDVIFATSTPLTIAIPALIYSKLKKVPLVFEVRDLWPELPIAAGVIQNPLVIKFAQWLERYTYLNSKRLIGLSPGMCKGITKHGVPEKHVTLATNSCDTELFDIDREVGRQYLNAKLSFVDGRILIVYTGTFGLINDVSYLVKLAASASSLNKNLCFLAVGDGMEKKTIIEEAERAGVLNKNLYILDPLPKTEIVYLLSASDLALSLFGSVQEMWNNSANKLFDALASSTPIAINYGGWQKDFIEKHGCGIVISTTDYDEAVNDISKFFDDNSNVNKAIDNCKVLAYEHFSRDIMANRIEVTLKEAIND
jgi:glycosyltransferase involved in cell wall biosynthesis